MIYAIQFLFFKFKKLSWIHCESSVTQANSAWLYRLLFTTYYL